MESNLTSAQLPHNLNSTRIREYVEKSGGRIQAQVSSFKNGLQIYKNISIVRIASRQSNLIIMEDYMPVIGEIEGVVDLISKTEMITLKDVRGIFCHEHNVFFLLLKES